MNSRIVLVFALLMSSLLSNAQKKINYPIIEIDSLVRHAGKIPEGPPHIFEFNITNISNRPVIILRVRSSCGCLVPNWSKEPILPGESSIIKGIYSTKGRPGVFYKTMTVQTNAKLKNSDNETITLVMKGYVIPKKKIELVPERNILIKD